MSDATGKTYQTKTDEDGNFTIDVPTNQSYKVQILAPGYKTLTFNWNPREGKDYFSKIKLEKKESVKEGNFEILEMAGVRLLFGWNLISLPVSPTRPLRASDLIDEINKQGGLAVAVSRWQGSYWETYLAGLDKNNFQIEVGKAYFVENFKETKFKLEGEEITQPQVLNLMAGWNTVGVPKTVNCYSCSAKAILNLINKEKPGAGRVLSKFESGFWESVAFEKEEFYGRNFDIEPSRGYFLKVSQPVNLLP